MSNLNVLCVYRFLLHKIEKLRKSFKIVKMPIARISYIVVDRFSAMKDAEDPLKLHTKKEKALVWELSISFYYMYPSV